MHITGWLYFLDKNHLPQESNYLNGKLPDKISSWTGISIKFEGEWFNNKKTATV